MLNCCNSCEIIGGGGVMRRGGGGLAETWERCGGEVAGRWGGDRAEQ